MLFIVANISKKSRFLKKFEIKNSKLYILFMFKFQINKLPKSTIEIVCETEAEDIDKARAETIKNLLSETEIDGFRKGFAPEKILIEKISEGKILEKAAEKLIQKTYFEILEKNNLEIIGRPEIQIFKIAKGNPLVFKIIAAVIPKINLPDYNGLAKEIFADKEKIKIEEREIEASIEKLKNFLGERLKNQGQEEKIELNDEFAKKVGKFNTLRELKSAIAENLILEKKIKSRDKKRIEAIEKIAANTTIELPEVLIEAEKEKMLGELKHNILEMGLLWDKYLAEIKKTEEELLKNFEPDAKKRAAYGLVLREIAKKEKIEVQGEEVEKYLEQFFKIYPKETQNKSDETGYRNYAFGLIRNEKVFQLLENKNND